MTAKQNKSENFWDDPSDYKKKDNRKWDHNHNDERHEKIKNRWGENKKGK